MHLITQLQISIPMGYRFAMHFIAYPINRVYLFSYVVKVLVIIRTISVAKN